MHAPRRLIRGYRNLSVFVGRGETWIRAKIIAGKFPPPDVTDVRMVGWYEPTIAQWQAERAERLGHVGKKRKPYTHTISSGAQR